MNYKKIEELFVDFILNVIGPNEKSESDRNINLSYVKGIILNILTKKLPDYRTHILAYGSFPIKTYLKDADIDITIFFELKYGNKVVVDIPTQFIDKAMIIIKAELEKHNKESKYEHISDIKIIMAGIRLLKCKIGSINIDISINNFAGLYKILFIDFIENQLKFQFNKKNLFNDSSYKDNKINIFKRTLLLIKGWCFYEGKLMGSNIGLMASYTLEILVIFLFNLHYDEINNEYEAFEKFFELMEEFDWEKNVISLYGLISNFNFYKKLQSLNNDSQKDIGKEVIKNIGTIIINKPFWYIENKKSSDKKEKGEENDIKTLSNRNNEPLLDLKEVIKFISSVNNGAGNIHILKEGNAINGDNFNKLLNVLDPMNNHNNLGKSINYHSNSKMKLVIAYINKKLKKIKDIRKKSNPFLYMNSLLNLFKLTLTKKYVELFVNSLNSPGILGNSKIFNKFYGKEKSKINIDKNEIKRFNNLFLDSPRNDDFSNLEDEDFDDYVEEEDIEEKDSNNEEDEDKDEYEENVEKNIKSEIIDEDNDYKENLEIKENIIFELIINNEIMKDLFEQKEKKQDQVKYNNKLLKESKDYANNLEKLLKEHHLI